MGPPLSAESGDDRREAVTPAGLPLGLWHQAIWARDPEQLGKKHQRRQRRTEEKESQKWLVGRAGVEAALPAEPAVLEAATQFRRRSSLPFPSPRAGEILLMLPRCARAADASLYAGCLAGAVQKVTAPV